MEGCFGLAAISAGVVTGFIFGGKGSAKLHPRIASVAMAFAAWSLTMNVPSLTTLDLTPPPPRKGTRSWKR
jgi:Na+-translocating ferredoxin:NAD+ oxidoreductase RnfD subunit